MISKLYKISKSVKGRLSEMGLIKNTIFRIVKRVFGMVQLRFKDYDLILREETFKEIEYTDE